MDGVRNGDALWDWNLVTNRAHFSPAWLALIGAEEHDISNRASDWLLRVHPDDAVQVSQELDAARDGGTHSFEFRHRLRHNNGSYRWVACRGAVIRDEADRPIRLSGSHTDLTDDTVADRLTGLPSRVLLTEHTARALERDARYGNLPLFAVLLLGLDRSRAPASLSTASVDAPLLTAVARRLETWLRTRPDGGPTNHIDLVARVGDDEFAILLQGLTEIGDSKVVADRILVELQSPVSVGGRHVYVSASIGIASASVRWVAQRGVRHGRRTVRTSHIAPRARHGRSTRTG
jgi:diguanylate cyclase (GGDEF)-like protein/PAS domain S-box-containing protein